MHICPGNRQRGDNLKLCFKVAVYLSHHEKKDIPNHRGTALTRGNTRKSRLSSMYTGTFEHSLPQKTERETHPTFSYQHTRRPAQKQSRSPVQRTSFPMDMHQRTLSKLQSTPSDASSASVRASFFRLPAAEIDTFPSASLRSLYKTSPMIFAASL
jgi:hypothetical protein